MAERDPFELVGIENNIVDEIKALRLKSTRTFRRNLRMESASEVMSESDVPQWFGEGDPTDAANTLATGYFIFPAGLTIDGVDYLVGHLIEGVLQWGSRSSDGAIVAGPALLDENGLSMNGQTITDALVSLLGLGWIVSQTATANSETRTFRMGMQDNGSYPEGRIEFYETGAAVSVSNGDFASNDMTGWTQDVTGKQWAAFGTLTPTAVRALAVDGSGNIYAAVQGGTTSSVWKYSGGSWAAVGTLSTSYVIYSMCIDGSNNVYVVVGSQNAATSAVWKWNGTTWSAVGTLDTTLVYRAIVRDSSNNLYVAIEAGGTTSSVWKWNGTTWAALGTLSTSFNVYSLAVDASNNIYAGLGSGATTSSVWKWNGASWAAYGTLSTSFNVWCLALDGSSNLHAGLQSGTTSSVWKYSSSAWAALGTLSTSFRVKGLAFDGNGYLWATGDTGWTTSAVWTYAGGSWVASSTLATNAEYALLYYSGVIYFGGQTNTTSRVWALNSSIAWSGANGYAELTDNYIGSPSIRSTTRMAVTAGTNYLFSCRSWLNVAAGSCVVSIVAKFYTAVSGGSLVQTLTVGSRTAGGSTWNDHSASALCPATATHVEFVATLATVNGNQTVYFDDFTIVSSNAEVLAFRDDQLYAEFDGTSKKVLHADDLPVGYLLNGKINVSVASNNLTMSILTNAGATPSVSDPVLVRIGNTVYTITSAMTKTWNAGTNWADMGSSVHATYSHDIFPYVLYNSTAGALDFGWSRLPFLETYADASGTSTNERYFAFASGSTPASTDELQNIGRVSVTLSASASYNWSITGTGDVRNEPTYISNYMTFALVATGCTSTDAGVGGYMIIDRTVHVWIYTNSMTSNSTAFTLQGPFALTGNETRTACFFRDNGSTSSTFGSLLITSGNTITCATNANVGTWTNVNAKFVRGGYLPYGIG